MSDAAFSRIVNQQVLECRWPDISERWLQYVPVIEPPGSAPSEGLSDFIGFTQIAAELGNGYENTLKRSVDGLREYVFREGVFLLHKALHVSGCAQNQVKTGYKTWSLPEAYQAALFAVKSILSFCGIALGEYNSKAVLVDIFPKEQDRQKRQAKLKLRLLDDPAIQFTKFNMQFQHRHVWTVFQRMLAVFQMDSVWPTEYTTALSKLGKTEFAKQRNALNYQNNLWIFDDLHELAIDDEFGVYRMNVDDGLTYELQSSFSVVLAIVTIRLAVLLLDDISRNTSLLSAELDILVSNLSPERQPLYLAAFPSGS